MGGHESPWVSVDGVVGMQPRQWYVIGCDSPWVRDEGTVGM